MNHTTLISAYPCVLSAMLVLALLVCPLLFFVSAPYGRHVRPGWGPMMNALAGWLIMESPASLLMLMTALYLPRNPTLIILLGIWQIHYFHRAFVYPFTLQTSRPMPVVVMLMAFGFNVANAYLNGMHFIIHADQYVAGWLLQPLSIAGLVVFATGFYITKKSDSMLGRLRSEATSQGEGGYRIPRGFLFRWVSCPNYLGESIQWFGWCLLTQAPAAWVFLAWTLANLVPRAVKHHQ